VFVAQEVADNRFKIAGGSPALKVSWQLTGIRKDAWALAHPLIVEKAKTADERGFYQHPEVHGQPAEKAIHTVRLRTRMEAVP
jgi:hypothetical protein